MKRLIVGFALAALCLTLCACASLLEKDYGVVEPHADRYWESAADDIMRAESYQDLVNTILLLVEDQEDSGVIRLYLSDVDYDTAWSMVQQACAEVRTETPIGSYSLYALDFSVEELVSSYYEVGLLPTYRRTREEIEAIVETASSGAIYDLVLSAWESGQERLAVRYTYLAEDENTLAENILLLQQELEGGQPGEDGGDAPELTPWEIYFYPPGGGSSIVEIFFR